MTSPRTALVAALALLVLPSLARAATKQEREELKKTLLDVLGRPALKNARTALMVQSLDDGQVVFAQNQDELLNPASNVKLVTSAAALSKLGPEYRFETEFLLDGELPADGKTKGLWVRGKGDPSITTERLYGMVQELWHNGLREVNGDLFIDDTWFDAERLAPGYDQETSDRAYMAPTGAVSLNWNTVGIYLRPGGRACRDSGKARKGDESSSDEEGGNVVVAAAGADKLARCRAVVELEPESAYFQIENQLVTGASRYRRFSVSSDAAGEQQRIVVRGTVPAERGTWAVWKRIDNPPMYFGETLKAMLVARGVKVKGKVKLASVPPTAKPLYVAQSETFDLILKRLNKNSSNFVAEQLIKTMGAELKGAPGSHAKGIEVVEEFLEQDVGIPRGSYVMKNGSGLNDTNRFAASQFLKILKTMWDRFPTSPEYLSALGIAGKDGTLRYRFEGSEAVGRLRAKTGTLENVSALSGYVQAAGGEKLIFSMMVNDYAGRSGPVIQGLDALGTAVAASGSKLGPNGAVAQLASQQSVVSPLEEAKTRITTFRNLGKQQDKRNVAFLRTSWRNERDPAVRAVLADAIYQSNAQDYLGARALLDSFTANDDVYGRLRKISRDLKIEVPGVSSVLELGAEGNTEALVRLAELARASQGDAEAEADLADAITEVVRTAPDEWVVALKSAQPADRDAAMGLLARGLVKAGDPNHPLWPTLKRMMGALDHDLATFAARTEGVLATRIAQEKAPKLQPGVPVLIPTSGPVGATPAGLAETRPGG